MVKVFISHITEESRLATIFQEHITADFLNMVEVFVSSDGTSIGAGSRWLTKLDTALQEMAVSLILCSQASVKRPWINFEAGAAWVKNIPSIPICHTDMTLHGLPTPLNALQGVMGSHEGSIRQIYLTIAQAVGSAVPKADFTSIADQVRGFEEEYGLVGAVRAAVHGLLAINPELVAVFQPKPIQRRAIGKMLLEPTVNDMRPFLDALQARGMLHYEMTYKGMMFGEKAGGNAYDMVFDVSDLYYQIADKVTNPNTA